MTTSAELDAQFVLLKRTALKVKRDRDELLEACRTASHALKSYQHGNAAPDLAIETAALLDATIDRAQASV
jgi:hypothetical protein